MIHHIQRLQHRFMSAGTSTTVDETFSTSKSDIQSLMHANIFHLHCIDNNSKN